MLNLIDDFDENRAESAPWMEGMDMCMFCHGNAFEEKEFCAIGYGSNAVDMMKQ